MSKSEAATAAPKRLTRDELHEMLRLVVDRMREYLETQPTDKLRASMLDNIRKLLVDAGIAAEVREARAARSALGELEESAVDLDAFTVPFPTVEQ